MKVCVWLPFFLILLVSGCFKKTMESNSEQVLPETLARSQSALKLKLIDTLIFNLDNRTSPKSWIFQFKILNDTPFYIIANQAINSLQVYKFGSPDVYLRIPFAKDGPEKNIVTENFYLHNWDSIFFVSSISNQIMLFDYKGSRKDAWKINWGSAYANFQATTMEYYFKPNFDSHKTSISFWMVPPIAPHKRDFYEQAKAVEYYLASGELQAYGRYPENYFSTEGTHIVLCPMNGFRNNEYNILYFGGSSKIYFYDNESKILKKVLDARSRFLTDDPPPMPNNGAESPLLEEREKYYIMSGFYEYFFANEDFSLYYRLVKLPNEFKYPDGKVWRRDDFRFSLMIFDDELKLVDEIVFPGGQFDYRQSFAYKNRVYLNMNNPLNKIIDEDHLVFAVYALE